MQLLQPSLLPALVHFHCIVSTTLVPSAINLRRIEMATQESSGASKLPLILAGASVAVSTTVAALAVWWATSNAPKPPKKSKLAEGMSDSLNDSTGVATHVYVRNFPTLSPSCTS